MAHEVKIREQYLDYKPPVMLYGSLQLLLRYVPQEQLADLRAITLTNSAALLKSWRGKLSSEKGRVRPADCRGLYGRSNIILVVDQMFSDCPEILLLFPPMKTYLIALTLYHEIGHHIHKLEQPGYRAERETFADQWRDKLLRDFLRQRYWYFGLLVRGLTKLFPSLRGRRDAPPVSIKISDILADNDRHFLRRNPPADESVLQEFISNCSFNLPNDYLEFIRCIDGAEGELGIDPGWFQLWPIEDVLKLNEGYQVEEFHPTYFGFGGSGGGVMFAFKRDASERSTVFGIPFDSIDPRDVRVVAETFMVFANAMGYSWTDDE